MISKGYKDLAKFRKARYKQNKRYYDKTAFNVNHGQCFTDDECELILEHSITDTELSKRIGRSVRAIQIKRSRLKKGGN